MCQIRSSGLRLNLSSLCAECLESSTGAKTAQGHERRFRSVHDASGLPPTPERLPQRSAPTLRATSIHAPQQRYRRFWRPSTPSIVGEAPSRATKPTTVVGYIIIIPVQASDPFAVALLERFGECGFRCFVACAVTWNDPDRAYTLD